MDEPRPLKILIVDDSPGMRDVIKILLSGRPMTFSECADGMEALERYAAERPDWVLMDIRMPRVDGLTATRQITEGFPEARVIVVTDYDDHDLRAEARSAGASAYILKEDLSELPGLIR